MPTLTIRDLDQSRDLDRQSMSAVRGGVSLSKAMGPFANVNVNVNQEIIQVQDIRVNALNNIGVLGADLGPLNFKFSPKQLADARVAL